MKELQEWKRWGKERVGKRKMNRLKENKFWERELKETNMKFRASQGKKIYKEIVILVTGFRRTLRKV